VLGQNQVIDYWSIAAERLAPVNGGFGGEFHIKADFQLLYGTPLQASSTATGAFGAMLQCLSP
jgi:hypothetical protein